MTVPRTSVNLSRLRHSDLIYFTETAVIFTDRRHRSAHSEQHRSPG